ncbi:DeoR/GlpR family DNA-binding transcription regulator [Galbibacter mesophilus]|uniref:DeoR/GlpR family DNA-binding transcription regulator n=1 Tax=Galbibacter mesophilus TaxID=379069 RepID=UPI00191CEAD2|nr:DeoR/GlpR family DNA-binding transcription regulator [Galbibacter mesophilus]MCM5663393.1 DeoR/GlpR family DNA-binding transcription regulator [Galbibacter mesophilus]
MDRHQRLQKILHELSEKEKLDVDEIGDMLSISPATVRRDFNYLAKHYKVKKTWGGIAIGDSNKTMDSMLPLQERQTINIGAKKSIAEKAASLVSDGDIIFIDGGTTTLEMVPFLVDKKVTIITNSILIAQKVETMNNRFTSEVFLTGGMLYPNSGLIVGPQALDGIKNFNAQWTFLSIGGISTDGPTNSNVLVVETEKAMIAQSEKTVILADSSKICKKDLVKVCDFQDIEIIISEKSDKDKELQEMVNTNTEILFV